MRLQLIAALAAVLATGARRADAEPPERGEGAASSSLGVYADDDATTIVTSMVDGELGLRDHLSLGAHVLVDSVTSASVDVVSAATPIMRETRVEYGARMGWLAPHAIELSLGYTHSRENDWQSNAVRAAAARELAGKNTRVSLAAALVGNRVGRAGDPTFEESQSAQTYELGVSQVLDRRTVVSATYTQQRTRGWQSSPYRYVTTADGRFTMLEHHPDRRVRHALGLRLRRYLWRDTAGELRYRIYRDDWGVLSHTVAGSLRYAPGRRWDLRLRARAYAQGAAHFWRMRYDAPMTYMSADRELSTFWNLSAGLRVARRLGPLIADAKVDLVRYRFLEFEPLDRRLALVAAAGAQLAW